MGFAPIGRDIELAIELYASAPAKAGVQEWQAMEWLWKELPWSARFLSHFGAVSLGWWKRKYILPVLCKAAHPFLEKFSRGEWTRSQESMVRRWFLFFSQFASAEPQLFSPELVAFLSDTCPSFCGREVFSRDETYARHRARQLATRPDEVESHEEVFRREETVSEETKEAARGLIGKLTNLRESVMTLSGGVDKTFHRAFPMRNEMQRTVTEIHSFQDELFSLLMTLDNGLLCLSDSAFGNLSNREAKSVLSEQGELLTRVRSSMPSLGSRSEELRLQVDELKNGIFNSIHTLVRSLDRLSVLDPSNPFHDLQARVVREAREQIKKFRLALAKGPGPEMSLTQLEELVARQIDLSEEFHAEGARISAIKEKLGRYESHIQVLLSEESHLVHKRSAELRDLLAKIVDVRAGIALMPDLEESFASIARAMEELDPVH
jgi:hypothetical protein